MARCERLRGAALRDVLGQAQGVLFDCDGVLWNGERIVPGAPELLQRLARAGKNTLLTEACAHLRDPDCLLVATDRDPWHPLSDGSRTPGTGSLAAAVETASGRQALVVGKPSPYMFQCITEDFSVDPARTLMVGDRLETDILFGHRCGMTTVLTLTGVSSLEEAQAYLTAGQRDLVPHYYVESIADLMEGLED